LRIEFLILQEVNYTFLKRVFFTAATLLIFNIGRMHAQVEQDLLQQLIEVITENTEGSENLISRN
jgi:hypothetical protein